MINFNTIDITIYDWVTTFTGITTIWMNDNGPKPNLPFIALRRSTLVSVGQGYLSEPDNNGLSKISGDRNMTVNIQAYGSNAIGRLDELYNIRLDNNSQELLYLGGLALIDLLAITDLTGLNDTEFEERAQMDLLFRLVSQRTNVPVGLIETIEIEGNLKNPNKTFNFDLDI